MGDIVGRIASWAVAVLDALGYPGIAVLAALENLIPPIPAEVILPLIGYLAGQGRFALLLALAIASVSGTAGAVGLFALCRWLGEDKVRAFVNRYGKFLLMRQKDIDRAHGWFERHGDATVLVTRMIPGLHSAISIPAGLSGMPLRSFTIYSFIGMTLWYAILMGFGWFLGYQWERVSEYVEIVQWIVLAAIAAAIIWVAQGRLREKGNGRGKRENG
jgi:membrane protein DedA with SNARE-associated domain